MLEHLLKPTIAVKLTFWFLLVSIVPLAVAAYLAYDNGKEQLRQEITDKLRVMVDDKANIMEIYLREKKKDIGLLVTQPTVLAAIQDLNAAFRRSGLGSAEYAIIANQIKPILERRQLIERFQDLFIISTEGDVIFSLNRGKHLGSNLKAGAERNRALAKVFDIAGTLLDVEISDFEYQPETGKPAAFIAAPFIKSGEVIGVAALQLNNDEIYDLIRRYKSFGETDETVVGSRIGDEAVFIMPTRHDPDAAFKRSVNIKSEPRSPLVQAIAGKKGEGIAIDYRGREVLAAWRYLPYFHLGINVKIDTVEAFQPIARLRDKVIFLMTLAALMSMAVALAVSRSLSEPIRRLHKGTETIGGGDLDYKVGTSATDEIGQLSRSFDRMVANLKKVTASRDELTREVIARTKAEKELQQTNDDLQKANRELDSFVHTVSHDLRAPLRAIAGFATFMEEDCAGGLDENGKKHLSEIKRGAAQMGALIEDLLKLSRISKIRNPYTDVDIGGLISSVIEYLRFDIDKYNAHIRTQLPMPHIWCDPVKIKEVFLNLINNAIKFSSRHAAGGPRIEVGYSDRGGAHEFFVKDNGIGIDSKYHDQIFNLFQRLHKNHEYEGTGAGLAIVKRIVEECGGTVWVESVIGQGSTFYFTIPGKDMVR